MGTAPILHGKTLLYSLPKGSPGVALTQLYEEWKKQSLSSTSAQLGSLSLCGFQRHREEEKGRKGFLWLRKFDCALYLIRDDSCRIYANAEASPIIIFMVILCQWLKRIPIISYACVG